MKRSQFSSNLQKLRKAWELSQKEMSEKFGVSMTSYSRWENGTEPSFNTIIAIAEFFKIPVDDLLVKEIKISEIPPKYGKSKINESLTFKEQIEQELEGLNSEQIVEFAWRCAVRALPFLGSKGHFDYWNKNDRQKHLFSVLYILDLVAAVDANLVADDAEVNEYLAAVVAADAASSDTDDAIFSAAYAYASSTFATAESIAAFAANAALSAANAALGTAPNFIREKIEISILIDVSSLKSGNHIHQIFIKDYGSIWGNFQSALEKEGCTYYSRVYQELFENNFRVDKKELERRLSVPIEIREQGAAAVADFLEKLAAEGAERLNEARIIILGDKGAGKTCIARRLINPDADMTTLEESTPGVDTMLWELKQEGINVRIWDFAGHTVTHAVHQFFLSERCLYIMVYDGRTEKQNSLEYWLGHMKNYGGDSQAIILLNEKDKHPVSVPINRLKEQFPIADFYSFNVKDDKEQLAVFRKVVADYIQNNPSWKNQEIPKSYYLVKEELEKRFNKKAGKKSQEHIRKEDFLAIAEEYKVEDPHQLLKDLNALGISLWYENMDEYKTLILNPEWISDGVYKIINWMSGEKTHEIREEDFAKVFEKEEDALRFPKDKYSFLFNLLKHYELAFETSQGKRLIVPHLLNEDQPAELPLFELGDSLQMKYEADMPLPPNTISRFIVRHNEQIKHEDHHWLVWKYGVILEDGKGSLALVREIDRSISVSVKGTEQTAFISQLRSTLNAIFETYKSKQPELTYRIIDTQPTLQRDLWLAETEIAALELRNRPYYDVFTDREISIKPTVVNYNITYNIIRDTKTLLIGGEGHQVIENTFNFHECSVNLQGQLNDLARQLSKNGHIEEAEEVKEAAEVLNTIEKGDDKEAVKRKGVFNRLKRIAKDLGDKDTVLYKTVEGLRRGKEIAQEIVELYNNIGQFLGSL